MQTLRSSLIDNVSISWLDYCSKSEGNGSMNVWQPDKKSPRAVLSDVLSLLQSFQLLQWSDTHSTKCCIYICIFSTSTAWAFVIHLLSALLLPSTHKDSLKTFLYLCRTPQDLGTDESGCQTYFRQTLFSVLNKSWESMTFPGLREKPKTGLFITEKSWTPHFCPTPHEYVFDYWLLKVFKLPL